MTTKVTSPPTADILAAAFDKHLPAFKKLTEEELLARINFDVASAVAIVLGAVPALLSLRGELIALPGMKPAYLDELQSVAYATLHAHMLALAAPEAVSDLPALAERARVARKKLHADAVSAIGHELLPEDALEGIPTGNGRLEIARGLLGLSVAFRARWNDVKGKSPVTLEALDAAAQLAVTLLTELGRDDNPTASKSDNAHDLMRLRACSYLAKIYGECRRGVAYVRWHHDDAGDFAPLARRPPRPPRPHRRRARRPRRRRQQRRREAQPLTPSAESIRVLRGRLQRRRRSIRALAVGHRCRIGSLGVLCERHRSRPRSTGVLSGGLQCREMSTGVLLRVTSKSREEHSSAPTGDFEVGGRVSAVYRLQGQADPFSERERCRRRARR